MTASRRRPLRRVGDLLPGVAEDLGLAPELRMARAMATWSRIVGERVPGGTAGSHLEAVRGDVLVVVASDATLGQELRLRSDELLEAFSTAPGGTRVTELRVVVRAPGERGRPAG